LVENFEFADFYEGPFEPGALEKAISKVLRLWQVVIVFEALLEESIFVYWRLSVTQDLLQ
jgi:hypothetical protein